MGTLIVSVFIISSVLFVLRQMIHDKKKGKSLSCGCDCSNCKGCR